MFKKLNLIRIAVLGLLLLGLMMVAGSPGLAREKYETISASAFGTGTQVGGLVRVNLVIYQFSTPEEMQVLINAFQSGQNPGLVNALQKMKAAGHIDVTGTMGYDVGFIRMVQTPTGRTIRFITNRKIAFAEARSDSQSMSFDLTAGEINLDDQDRKKSSGVLYPAAQIVINKNGEMQFDLNQNAWRLEAVTDSKGSADN